VIVDQSEAALALLEFSFTLLPPRNVTHRGENTFLAAESDD